MINKEQLKEIIEDLKEVVGKNKLWGAGVTSETIFQEACSYQRGLMAARSRNYQPKKKEINPITENQQQIQQANEKKLRKMGFDIDNIQSKSDAFKIIKQFKEVENEN